MINFFVKQRFGILFLVAMIATACASHLKLQSEPSDAEVFISQQNSLDRKLLGKTPFDITYSQLVEKAGGTVKSGEFYVLSFELKDHEVERLLMPPLPFGTSETNVVAKLIPSKDANQAKEILQRMHNAQKFAQNGQFDRALAETDKILDVDGKFARALSLKGSVYYLQKNYDEALVWFEKALASDPSFDDALRMINKIKIEKKK